MHRSQRNASRRAPWMGAAALVLAPALSAQQSQERQDPQRVDPAQRERAEEMLDQTAEQMKRGQLSSGDLDAAQAHLRDAVLSRLRAAAVDGELEPRRLLLTSLADGTIVAAVPVAAFGAGRAGGTADRELGRDPAAGGDSTDRLGDDDGIADDAARAREAARERAEAEMARDRAGAQDPGLAQGPVIGLLLVQGSGLQAGAIEAGAADDRAGAGGAQRARLQDGVYTIRSGLAGSPVVTDESGRTVARVTRLGAAAPAQPADPAGGRSRPDGSDGASDRAPDRSAGERELDDARSGLIADERTARELEPREWFELYLALLQSLDVRHR